MLRRDALRLTAVASVAALAVPAFAAPPRDEFVDAPDVVLFCDPALRGPMRRLGGVFRDRTGVPVRLLCAPGRLMAAQLTRNERDDIFISLLPVMQQLAASNLVDLQPFAGSWRNRLVIACKPANRTGAAPPPQPHAAPDRLAALLADGKFGVPDPSLNAVVDSPALIRRLGLERVLAGRIVGEVDTGGVAWLLAQDRIALGLVLATEAREGGFLTAIAIPDDAYPPVRYAAAFSKHVLSRNAEAFMRFLATMEARASLAECGLEVEA
jgi:ABC-type molybdate transport system substrate-binding protein